MREIQHILYFCSRFHGGIERVRLHSNVVGDIKSACVFLGVKYLFLSARKYVDDGFLSCRPIESASTRADVS